MSRSTRRRDSERGIISHGGTGERRKERDRECLAINSPGALQRNADAGLQQRVELTWADQQGIPGTKEQFNERQARAAAAQQPKRVGPTMEEGRGEAVQEREADRERVLPGHLEMVEGRKSWSSAGRARRGEAMSRPGGKSYRRGCSSAFTSHDCQRQRVARSVDGIWLCPSVSKGHSGLWGQQKINNDLWRALHGGLGLESGRNSTPGKDRQCQDKKTTQ